MTTLLAALDFNNLAIGVAIGAVIGWFSVGTSWNKRPEIHVQRLERQMRELQNKLDALLEHHGVEMPSPPPSDLSPEVQFLAKDPDQKIAAIKLYREEHPGVGLAEAKTKIEEFNKSRP